MAAANPGTNVVTTVAYPAYSATQANHVVMASDDVMLRVASDPGDVPKKENHTWLVQGVFSTVGNIENNGANYDNVRPVQICHNNGIKTWQMQPIMSSKSSAQWSSGELESKVELKYTDGST
jgi:hypothetical protein